MEMIERHHKRVPEGNLLNVEAIGSEIIGGKGGGGRKDFAQAGGIHKNKIEEAFDFLRKKIN